MLSKDGNSQLYAVNTDGSGVQRLTQSAGIDTEPRYSADGASIYFTSDRGGSPQIYRIDANALNAEVQQTQRMTALLLSEELKFASRDCRLFRSGQIQGGIGIEGLLACLATRP